MPTLRCDALLLRRVSGQCGCRVCDCVWLSHCPHHGSVRMSCSPVMPVLTARLRDAPQFQHWQEGHTDQCAGLAAAAEEPV